MTEQVFGCPVCGAPLATSTRRCPSCRSYVGFARPSPFTIGWWCIYGATVIALLTVVAVVSAVTA